MPSYRNEARIVTIMKKDYIYNVPRERMIMLVINNRSVAANNN